MTEQLSHEEVERMRKILRDHDSQKPVETIDLNNPPRKSYHYEPFPKMVYDLENSIAGHIVSRVVRDENQLADALADGFSKEAPAFGACPEEELSPKYQAEAEQVQQEIEKTRKRRGQAA